MKTFTLQQQMNNNKASVSWARWSWRERFDRWLQADDHVPVIEKAGSHAAGNVTYKFGKGSWMTPRTLSMAAGGMVTVCAIPDVLKITNAALRVGKGRRHSFLHEMWR